MINNLGLYFKKTDIWLWLLVLAGTIYSFLLISDMQRAGTYNYVVNQLIGVILGVILAIVISLIDYNFIIKMWWLFAIGGLVLAGLVFILGRQVAGTDDTAWVKIGAISFQPSEFIKICFIITFTKHISMLIEYDKVKTVFGVVTLLIHTLIPIAIIHIQGDDGAVLIFGIIALALCFLAGVQARYFAILGGLILVGTPIIWNFFLNNEHRNRILALFDLDGNALTNYGWQQYQGKVSIASGGTTGFGLYQGTRVGYGIVPEQENDFIFTVAGEEFGFIGCVLLLVILFALCLRILFIGKKALDCKGKFICYGIFALILSQTIINIGMVLGMIPVIGITLPFFSSGGTSVMSMMICIGLVQSVVNHQEQDMDSAIIPIGSLSRNRM